MVNYTVNGVTYNMDNIMEYMKKDYWDADDLKFGFWFRMDKHQGIINKVLELNGLVKSNFTGNDHTNRLKAEMEEKNREYAEKMDLNLDFNWGDD